MTKFRYKHIQSTVENKVPSDLLDGEIAVNRFKGKEKLFLKNASGDVVSFSSDGQIDGKLADKLNVSDFNTYSGAVNTTINSKAAQSDLNTLSGTVTAHTASTSIHLTTTEKTNIDSLATNIAAISGITSTKVGNWDTAYGKVSGVTASTTAINSLTGSVGTMAFQNTSSYSSATQVNTALGGKSNTGHTHVASDVTDLGTAAKKGVSNGISNTDNLIEAKHIYSGVGVTVAYDEGTHYIQLKSTSGNVLSSFDASAFLVDGMVDSVTLESKSGTTYLVITWNTAAGKTKTELNIGDIFEADNYYTKNDLTAATGYATVTKANSANTASTVALTGVTGADDLKAIEALTGTSGLLKKTAANNWTLDTTSYSSATQVNTALAGKSDTGHTHDDRYYTESELTGSTTTVVVAKAASATTAASATVADSANSVALSNVSGADDLKAIEALAGTSGILKKTAANTWSLDTTSYSSATQVNTALGNKVDKVSGKGLSTNDYTTDEKNKLSGIADGAEVNQNAFSNIKVGSTTIEADGKTDTLEISGSGIINITADATNDKITISASNAVTSVAGKTGAVTLVKGDVGLGNVDNTADANKTVKAATSAQTADSAKAVALSGVSNADDLKAIEALTGTSGLLKKTAANTWILDTTDYSNKNAFGKIKINAESTTIDSDTTNDTLTISGGSFVTLTSDATNDKFTIGVSTGTSSSDLARGDHNHDGAYQAKGSYLTGTTKYAGSSTQGGAATSANKLNTDAGSATNPIYFSGGVPTALSYTIEKSVPSNAVFTDTKVTTVGNHYTPSATSADTKSATASSTAELAWGSAVVTGVTLSGDAKGHITSVTLASGKLKTPVTGVTLASGTNNGTVKLTVNGTATDNIAVKGLSGMAYQATSSYSSATQVNTALSGKQDTLTFDGTYNASTNKAATVSTVTDAIGALDASLTGSAGAGKTLTAFSQTDGKVTATFGNISITKSQVSDFAHNQASNTITAMTSYSMASASGAVATNDSLNTAVGKLEKRIAILEAAIGGMTLVKLTSAQYEALTTKDPNTMYIIND